MTTAEYKKFLITNILKWQMENRFIEEELNQRTIRALERIHDNV